MSDLSIPVQEALIARYRGDVTLQGLMAGAAAPEWNIFDQGGSGGIVPTFPYVYAHPFTMATGTLLAMGSDANDLYLLVNVYTKAEGFAQARQIAARLYALTHGPVAGQLTLSSGVNALTLFENRQELEEVQDGLIQRVVDRYKVETQG